MKHSACIAVVFAAAFMLSGCNYVRLLRPSVLKQLNPDVVRLVNELPAVDDPNERTIARLFAHGGLEHAERGRDGVYRADIYVPKGEFIWRPAIIVMEEAGELELEFANLDSFSHHGVYLPNNGERMVLHLPSFERGRARIQLDGPGLYWFGCPVSDHAGRGMLGLVVVSGDVPPEARLDRPKQPQPE